MQIGDRDKQGNQLRLGGWKADVWQTPYNRFRVAITGDPSKFSAIDTEEEAVKLYNHMNSTKLKELPKLPSQFSEDKPTTDVPLPKGSRILGKIESKSRVGEFNYIVQYPSGEVICTCTGFGYRHYCWHTNLIKDILNQGITIDRPIVIKYTKEPTNVP